MRPSNSFGEDEIEFLAQLLPTVLRGGDTKALARSKALGSVYRKVMAMRSKIEEHAKKVLSGKPAPEVKTP